MNDIINFDKQLLVYLNNLGSKTFDGFWLFITNQFNLAPLFLFIFYLLYKKIGWRNLLIALLFIALIIMVCDQTTNLFKYAFQRLRPINDPEIKDSLRIIKTSSSYSFFSGHSSNSMATTVFLFMAFRKHFKFALLLFLFPLIFAYTRIYLGLHFPTDIITGYSFGILTGLFFYTIYKKYTTEERFASRTTLLITIGAVIVYFAMCNILVAQLKSI